ncbi:MAG: EAL and HDOD domain-containing protein [Nitrospiria bacterium]
MSNQKVFLARQPILDKDNNVLGFEILFRSNQALDANIGDVTQTSAGAIMHTLSQFGFNEVVGKHHRAFFNVNIEILMSEMIELLPKEQVVIELLGSIEIDNATINRCQELKKMGFSLALADFIYKPAYEKLFEAIDIIKIDFKGKTSEELKETAMRFRNLPQKLLAESVKDVKQFEQAKSLGFEMFQGYYFAQPKIISGKKVDLDNVVVMKLMNQMLRDVGLSEIQKTFRESPSLSYNLLRLVNSVSSGVREKISSVRHAIVLLGRDRLNRWAQVLLFTHGDSNQQKSPLLSTAVMRGRYMELLVEKGAIGGKQEVVDLAFMTGILSLIDALMGKPMKEIIDQMGVVDSVCHALLDREGDLGQLLSLVEAVERSDHETIVSLMERCKIDRHQLLTSEQEATIWTQGLTEAF